MIRVQKFLPQNRLQPISKLKFLVFNTFYEMSLNEDDSELCLIVCKPESESIDTDMKI